MITKLDSVNYVFEDDEVNVNGDVEPSNNEVFLSTETQHDIQKLETFLEWHDKLTPQEFERRMKNETD